MRNGFAVAYVIAEQSDLSAYLLQPTELEKVRAAYRDVMHGQARDLMARSSWADALLLWQHLHQRKLVSQQLYLDAARCFQRLGQAPGRRARAERSNRDVREIWHCGVL